MWERDQGARGWHMATVLETQKTPTGVKRTDNKVLDHEGGDFSGSLVKETKRSGGFRKITLAFQLVKGKENPVGTRAKEKPGEGGGRCLFWRIFFLTGVESRVCS